MRGAVLLIVVACSGGVACNAVSGVDELQFPGDGGRDGGGGVGTTSAASAGGGGRGGGHDAGGAGGAPCECAPPRGACQEPAICDGDGSCVHPVAPKGTRCDDGDGCTIDDTCDAEGTCVPGPTCPNDDLCKVVLCSADRSCVSSDLMDGASCGAAPAARCCGGVCVDISSDPSHCGACGAACAPGNVCESVAATQNCDAHPADTSGRCTCLATSQCPLGQVCRTLSPYPDRCTPDDPSQCLAAFHDLEFCPNYCSY